MDENIDFSAAFEKVQELLSGEDGQNQLRNILGALTNGHDPDAGTDPDDCESSIPLLDNLFTKSDSSDSFDMDMLLKLQKLMSIMKSNKNNPQTDFLQTLKPFLKSNRRSKLDQAVKLINAVQVIKVFKSINEGSD